MIVILKQNADPAQLNQLENFIHGMGLEIHKSQGENSTILGLVGDTSKIDIDMIGALDIVENVKRIQEPYKNANRKFHPTDTVVDVGGVKIGGGAFPGHRRSLLGGEPRSRSCEVAHDVKAAGATLLRGGAFKPRTSPYAFQGLRRRRASSCCCEAKKETGLPIVTEIMDISHLPLFDDVDVIQVGARNMQNFELLKELGHTRQADPAQARACQHARRSC